VIAPPWQHLVVRVLVVEDDPRISEPMREGLTRAGYEVVVAATGADALAADGADLVLLDLGLPDLDGQTVCRELRARSSVPIIVVSARGEEIDRVLLLELGADDYVVKPFGFRELVARIRAVSRRVGSDRLEAPAPATTTVGALTIDDRTRRVAYRGVPVTLTPKEYELLQYLAADPGAVRSREQLMHDVWDEHWLG
jgi:DNA-binding response OmpR family regulator